MEKEKKNAIAIIISAAKEYEEYLNNRQFLIIYLEREEQKFVEVGFRSMHFLHLTGVRSSLSAQRFYEACLNRKLAEKDIELDKTGKTRQKLQVLPYLSKLLYHNCMIGDYLNNGVLLRADYFVGDTKMVMSVGFRNSKGPDIPVTLYRGDVRKIINPTNKVLAIYRRTFPEKTYTMVTYKAKEIDLNELQFPAKGDQQS